MLRVRQLRFLPFSDTNMEVDYMADRKQMLTSVMGFLFFFPQYAACWMQTLVKGDFMSKPPCLILVIAYKNVLICDAHVYKAL